MRPAIWSIRSPTPRNSRPHLSSSGLLLAVPSRGFVGRATTKRFDRIDEAFFPAREDTLKRSPDISTPDQTTGFDHVGIHPQPDLPAFLQEISGRRAKVPGTEPSLELTASHSNGSCA